MTIPASPIHNNSFSRLEKLDRHPDLQALYSDQFFAAIKAAYGSTESFLMKRLNWRPETVEEARRTHRYFTSDMPKDWVRVARNDWAYGVPRDFECAS